MPISMGQERDLRAKMSIKIALDVKLSFWSQVNGSWCKVRAFRKSPAHSGGPWISSQCQACRYTVGMLICAARDLLTTPAVKYCLDCEWLHLKEITVNVYWTLLLLRMWDGSTPTTTSELTYQIRRMERICRDHQFSRRARGRGKMQKYLSVRCIMM